MKYETNNFSKEAQRAPRVVSGAAGSAWHRRCAPVQKIIDRA
ncbi:hypothetical protein BDD18_1578 [Acidovorax temperans]|uniref:Uncharacterized protein n=1 Tax=Acidovorax temperans TaxID=80878 RepID=A0A543LLY4_9BURK|nr:hypothetical protein BDD18_1578 [Acidovorax temperans]